MSTLALLLLAASPDLNDEVVEKRLEAVQTWAKGKKPQLSSKAARALNEKKPCVTVPAVAATGCTEAAKLCRVHEGDDGSSGTRIESVSVTLEHHDKPLRLWWTATYEPPVTECDPPEELEGHESEEHHHQEVLKWRKTHAKEWQACLQRVRKKALNDAEELTCNVVLVNACRHEAWVTCSAKNLRKGMTALTHLHRFEF